VKSKNLIAAKLISERKIPVSKPVLYYQYQTQKWSRMKIENIDIQATIEKAQLLIRDDKQLPAATKSMFEILILIITLLVNRLNLNSTNSSKPPISDPNRQKHPREKTEKKPAAGKVM
jgi:hypothetical protein